MNLPAPDPFSVPDSPEQAMSDFLYHVAITGGTYLGVYAVTGAYAGPGHLGMVGASFFSSAEVGAVGMSTNAFADTMFALSVYSEPLVAAANVAAVLAVPAIIVGGSAYIAHKINTDSAWQKRAQQLGSGMDFSSHFG